MDTGHAHHGHDATPGGADAVGTTPGEHATSVAAEWWVLESVGPAVFVLALTAYLLGVYRHRGRGPWPGWRTAAWIAGLTSVGVGWAGPLAEAAR
ncbi:cytochrome c oxidase assembly protein, partial [Dietzia sp. DQ11-71]|nr:cytochrome c oxidase assembly protein [Dietzia sp. DQ11-71]